MLADDTQVYRQVVRTILGLEGFDVVGEAADGEEAVRVIRELAPDVVLLDLSMPVMDGLQAIPKIRSASADTAIVVLSGLPRARAEEEALSLGARAYVEKGATPDAIVAAIRAAAGS